MQNDVIKITFLHIFAYLTGLVLVFQLGNLYQCASMVLIIQNKKEKLKFKFIP